MYVLVQSDTAGHYQVIGDQVNMVPKATSEKNRHIYPQNAGISQRLIKEKSIWNIKHVPQLCFLGILGFYVEFLIAVIILGLPHAQGLCKWIVFPYFASSLINLCFPSKFKIGVNMMAAKMWKYISGVSRVVDGKKNEKALKAACDMKEY